MTRGGALRLLVVLLLASAALRSWTFFRPPMYDEGIYAYGGREWFAHGRHLYEATLGGKPPGIFVVYGAATQADPGGFAAIRAFGVVLAALIAWCLALLAGEIASPRAGWLAGLGYLVMTSFRHGLDPPFVGAEMLVAACVAAALLAMVKARGAWGYAVAGLLGGLALQFRQTALVDCAGLLAVSALSFREKPVRYRSLLFVAGAAAVMGVVVACFAAQGQLGGLIQGGWLGQFQGGYEGGRVDHVMGLRHVGTFLVANALFVVLAIVAAVKALPTRQAAGRRAMWIWLVASALSPLASGPRYGHHLVALAPPLCVFAAIGLEWLLARTAEWRRMKRAGVAALAVLLAVPAMPDVVDAERCMVGALRQGSPPCAAEVLGRYIEAHSSPDDTMMFLGEAGGSISSIYLFADRRAPSRFISHDLLTHGRALAEVSSAFEARPPRWLVLDGRWQEELDPGSIGSGNLPPAARYILTFLQTHPYRRVEPEGTGIFRAYELQR